MEDRDVYCIEKYEHLSWNYHQTLTWAPDTVP